MIKTLLSELVIYLTNYTINYIPFHSLRNIWYKYILEFQISSGSSIHLGVKFDCKQNFYIGRNSTINANCRIDNRGKVTIGANVSISEQVIILTADHDPQSSSFQGRTSSINVGDYAWIGTRAMILPGVTIGNGSVIAAGSVVTKSVEPYTIVAGVPARKISKRNDNLDYNASYVRLFH